MKKTTLLTLTIALSACGGGSSSGGSSPAPVVPSTGSSVEFSNSLCNATGAISVGSNYNHNLAASRLAVSITDDKANVSISGANNVICITGSVADLEITGEDNKVYISSNVTSANISGSRSKLYLWGRVDKLVVSGSNVDVFGDAGSSNITGSNSKTQPISSFRR
ncbi:DUF3060 domain-containing protein [Bacterioplanoides sp.]|uniref:DUF3060 domain-containing protein n=1 Tax=Bacterioplanoides sp. TaxID=2066072 RepID=UPI003B59B472